MLQFRTPTLFVFLSGRKVCTSQRNFLWSNVFRASPLAILFVLLVKERWRPTLQLALLGTCAARLIYDVAPLSRAMRVRCALQQSRVGRSELASLLEGRVCGAADRNQPQASRKTVQRFAGRHSLAGVSHALQPPAHFLVGGSLGSPGLSRGVTWSVKRRLLHAKVYYTP